MATDGPVSRFNGVDYSGSDERFLHAGLLQRAGSNAFSARTGRRPGSEPPTVSGLTVTVPADGGVIYDPSLGGGPWLWAIPSAKQLTLAERPGVGTSRRDVIVARINDVAGQREVKYEIREGQASGSPSKPTLLPLSCEIAEIKVPASGPLEVIASTIRTVASGGVLPVATDLEREALPAPHSGLTVFNEQTGRLETRRGDGWVAAGEVPWASFTPGWLAGSNTPTLGNGSLTGQWRDNFGLIEFSILLSVGSTTSIPGGPWTFSLPATPAAGRWAVPGTATDVSPGVFHGVQAVVENSGRLGIRTLATGPLPVVGSTSPFAWASGDSLIVHGSYRRA